MGTKSRSFNLKFFIILLVLFVGITGGVFALNWFQVRNQSESLLTEAEIAHQEGDYEKEQELTVRFLALDGSNVEAKVRLATVRHLLMEEAKKKENPSKEDLEKYGKLFRRTYDSIGEALRVDPSQDELRRKFVDMAFLMREYGEARTHLRELLSKEPKNAELYEILARCDVVQGKFPDAAASLEKAIQFDNKRTSAYEMLIGIYKEKIKDASKTNIYLTRLISANPESARAYLLRARILRQDGQLAQALADVQKATELDPKDKDTILMSAELAIVQAEQAKTPEDIQILLDQAKRYLKNGAEEHKEDYRFNLQLARLSVFEGKPDDAVTWCLEGLKINDRNTELIYALADVYLLKGDVEKAATQVESLKQINPTTPLVDFLEARIDIQKGNWSRAISTLKLIRPQVKIVPNIVKQVDVLMGRCFEKLNNPDQRLAVFAQAMQEDPTWLPAKVGYAQALVDIGRIEEAKQIYEEVARLPTADVYGWNTKTSMATLSRVLYKQEIQNPKANRDWNAVLESAIKSYEANPDSIDQFLLVTTVYLSRRDFEKAAEQLAQGEAKFKGYPKFWLAKVQLLQLQKKDEEVDGVVQEMEKTLGDTPDVRLAKAILMSRTQSPEMVAKIMEMARQPDSFTVAEKARFYSALGEIFFLLNKDEEAEKLWVESAKLVPNELGPRVLMLDVAIRQKDPQRITKALVEIDKVEGKGPYWLFGEAQRLLMESKGTNASLKEKANNLLLEAARQRERWPRVYVAMAEIAEMNGNTDQALTHLLKAIDFGEKNAGVVRKAIRYLVQRGRFPEAESIIKQTVDPSTSVGDLNKIGVEVFLQTKDTERAVDWAKEVISADSTNFKDFIWRGQVYSNAKQFELAEADYRKALELAPTEPSTWVTLISHLSRTGKRLEAETMIEEAATKLPEGVKEIALAECYELVKLDDKANEQFEIALGKHPEDPLTVKTAASYYMRKGQMVESEKLLSKLITVSKDPREKTWARQNLAAMMVTAGGYDSFVRGIEYIDANLKDNPNSNEDKIIKARLLATRTAKTFRLESIKILEEFDSKRILSPSDQHLLFRMYDAIGDWTRARAGYRRLVTAFPDNLLYLTDLIRGYVAHGDPAAAAIELEKLTAIQPDSFAAFEMTLRIMIANKEYTQAIEHVTTFANVPEIREFDRLERQRLAAPLLEELGTLLDQPATSSQAQKLFALSETLYRSYVTAHPESAMGLASFLGRRKRAKEAIDVCEEGLQILPPPVVITVGLAIIRRNPDASDQVSRVEKWITTGLSAEPLSAQLLLQLADLRDFQQRFDETEQIYQDILKNNENQVIALNNLAWLRAVRHGKPDEGIELINRALKVTGPSAELLDTRGTIYVYLKKPEEAIRDLKESLTDSPNAVKHFHMAQALLLSGDSNAANESMAKARETGLDVLDLHALERKAYSELIESLK